MSNESKMKQYQCTITSMNFRMILYKRRKYCMPFKQMKNKNKKKNPTYLKIFTQY